MKKRVCETCRFFQEAGFAKNGWCNHPQRKESSDVRIVVRRNDLPCRNGWAQDLWTPPVEGGSSSDVVLHDTVSVRPVQPASVEELTFLVNAQREKPTAPEVPPPGGMPVDVVVGEAPSTKPARERQSLLELDPRAAILKAREQHRARKNAEMRQSDPTRFFPGSPDQAAGTTATPAAETYPSAHDRVTVQTPSYRPPRINDVPPVELSELPRNFPTITTFPEDEIKFSSIPEPVTGVTLPRPPTPVRMPLRATSGGEEGAAVETSDLEDAVSLPATTRPTSRSEVSERRHDEIESDRRLRRREPENASNGTPGAIEPESAPRRRRRGDRFDHRSPRLPDAELTVAETDAIATESLHHAEAASNQEIHESVAIYDELADVTPGVEIAPDVPRMCRTCRDFRPADSGERGWCTNKWAFSHRRMVDADELPCETSIGCWWLPHDDLWLATADASAHGQPTPLVEYWLAHRVAAADGAVGEQRRRQRS